MRHPGHPDPTHEPHHPRVTGPWRCCRRTSITTQARAGQTHGSSGPHPTPCFPDALHVSPAVTRTQAPRPLTVLSMSCRSRVLLLTYTGSTGAPLDRGAPPRVAPWDLQRTREGGEGAFGSNARAHRPGGHRCSPCRAEMASHQQRCRINKGALHVSGAPPPSVGSRRLDTGQPGPDGVPAHRQYSSGYPNRPFHACLPASKDRASISVLASVTYTRDNGAPLYPGPIGPD